MTSDTTDTPVDKFRQPVLNDENQLKLALFGINLRGGVTLSDVEGKVEATWEENRRLAQHADRLGLDAIVPVARWRGYGGDSNLGERSFETFTWATGLLAATERTFTLFTSLRLLFARNPRSTARVTGSMFGSSRAWPP